jgi:hypothetical protein
MLFCLDRVPDYWPQIDRFLAQLDVRIQTSHLKDIRD